MARARYARWLRWPRMWLLLSRRQALEWSRSGAGVTLFFGGLFLLGWAFFLVVLIGFAWPEWEVNRRFLPTSCTVLAKRIAVQQAGGEPSYRPEILIRYRVQGRSYQQWTYDITRAYHSDRETVLEALGRFQVGRQYPCWYDPGDPTRVVLVRGFSSYVWLLVIFPLTLVAVGAVGLASRLIRVGTTAERRAALVQQATASLPKLHPPEELPSCLPDNQPYTDSPGSHLAFRLPMQGHELWPVVALGVAALAWNTLAVVLIILAVDHLWRGHLVGSLFAVAVVATGAGMWLLYVLAGRLGRLTALGQTVVEISDHPLRPGGRYRLWVAQFGRLRLKVFRVLLICEEVAVFRQGTDQRKETQIVLAHELIRLEDVAVEAAVPLELEEEFCIPPGAMHSFRAAHNEVRWEVVAEGLPLLWPPFRRTFPVLVYPNEDPGEPSA